MRKGILTGLVNRARIPPPLKNTGSRSRALASKVRQSNAEVRLVRLDRLRDARILLESNQRSTNDGVGRSVDDRNVRGSGVGCTDVGNDGENLAGSEGLNVGSVHIRELE